MADQAKASPAATPLRFALVGAAGFIAPRHMKAIRETGNALVAALDPNDSVGIIDSYFPEADFFTEFERFDRHADKLRRAGRGLDWVSICSPNYLHDAHIRFALRSGARAICEKPVVLNPWNLDALQELEAESGLSIHTVLQLRLHPAIVALRERVRSSKAVHEIDLGYVTARGSWYQRSWKGDQAKSGGIATNIGVHFFDMLSWVFGAARSSVVNLRRDDCAAGVLELERARVRWFLSINADHLPADARGRGQRAWRAMTVGGESVEFSDGFADLHTECYRSILGAGEFRIAEARPSIEMVHGIRHAEVAGLRGDFHPMCRSVQP